MSKRFAKILELKDGRQVLLAKRWNPEEEAYEVSIEVSIEDLGELRVKPIFTKEEEALKFMENYTEADGEKWVASIVKMWAPSETEN